MKFPENPVYFIGAGPGDPELITVRGRKLLDRADVVIYAGSLVNPALLQGIKADIYDSAGMDLDAIISVMVHAHSLGRRIVRLHTGDPCLYGAVREQMMRLGMLGIPFRVVPGVSSAMAAAAALRAELTVPELTQTVIFTRQAGRTPVPPAESLKNLASAKASMCIFLSVSGIDTVVSELVDGGYPEETPAAVVEKASWPEERIIRGTLRDIAGKVKTAGIKKTAMIIVGRALGEDDHTESRLYHRNFSHEYRKA